MDKVVSTLAIVGALAAAFVWGWFAGVLHTERASCSENEHTTSDTVWVETHDTAWLETAVKISRIDTVKLAVVGANVHENAISGTYTDTLFIHDSVFVEVPIERKEFVGDTYRIVAHGFRVGIDEVHISYPVVTATRTQYKTKRWNFNAGAQIGYGYTIHGASPYAGIGVAFGYTF